MTLSLKAKIRRHKKTASGLKRRKGMRNLPPDRVAARRSRASANADLNRPQSTFVPAGLSTSSGQRQRRSAVVDKGNGPKVDRRADTKIDWATGRVMFPAQVGGKTKYLPLKSEATPNEIRYGSFVNDNDVKRTPVNSYIENGDSLPEWGTGRNLFATTNHEGKKEYLPSESDATALELANGKYIPDSKLEKPSIAKGLLDTDVNKKKTQLRYDFTHQRNLFAVRTEDGKDTYLPRKSDATAGELKRGLYVADDAISKKIDLSPATALTNEKPRYDLTKGRTVYAAKNKDGKTIYLPRRSDATDMEKTRGLFIDDDLVDEHEKFRRRTALKSNPAAMQARRAKRSRVLSEPPKKTFMLKPFKEAKDGTPLWDGYTPPEVSFKKQREALLGKNSTYDLHKGRMLYPVPRPNGKPKYFPLEEDATPEERVNGQYIVFVPPEPLDVFVKNLSKQNGGDDNSFNVEKNEYETDQGKIQAYSQDDIEKAFEKAPRLVLQTAANVESVAIASGELTQVSAS